MSVFNQKMLHSYLEQQASIDQGEEESGPTPSPEELEEFRNQVKLWIDLDVAMEKLKNAMKERKKSHTILSEKIGDFMTKYNIEDLQTSVGKVRCKKVDVKPQLTQKTIKSRVTESMASSNKPSEDLIEQIFQKPEGVVSQKTVLKRLGRSGLAI